MGKNTKITTQMIDGRDVPFNTDLKRNLSAPVYDTLRRFVTACREGIQKMLWHHTKPDVHNAQLSLLNQPQSQTRDSSKRKANVIKPHSGKKPKNVEERRIERRTFSSSDC